MAKLEALRACIEGAAGRGRAALDSFTQGYVEAAFFTSEQDAGDETDSGVPEDAGVPDLHPDAVADIAADCAEFQTAKAADLAALTWGDGPRGDHDEASAGRDLWFTRNHHGCGFRDRGFKGLARKAAARLTKAAHGCGESDLHTGDGSRSHAG